jgi:acetyl esterase/lipase
MTRRGILAATLGSLAAACSPLGMLNTLGPRDKGFGRVARDLAYGDDPRQKFDLYGPRWRPGQPTLPVIVFFYGGGWYSGSRTCTAGRPSRWRRAASSSWCPTTASCPRCHFPAFIEDAGGGHRQGRRGSRPSTAAIPARNSASPAIRRAPIWP